MSELKRCPFCGGDNVGVWHSKFNTHWYEVHCYDCHFGLSQSYTEEEAIKAWNTRKPMDRIVERLERNMLDNDDNNIFVEQHNNHYKSAIKIVKEEGGINE